MTIWTGVFPAVTTKMTQHGEIDLTATQDSIERLAQAGVAGVIVLPMLGENASLDLAEGEAVIGAEREHVIATVERARHALSRRSQLAA